MNELAVAPYDDVNMDSDVSSISMSINNGLLAHLLSIQQLPAMMHSHAVSEDGRRFAAKLGDVLVPSRVFMPMGAT